MSEQTAVVETEGRRRQSQEALDMRITYIPHAHKVIAASAALIIAAAMVWGVAGAILTKVSGQGIIVRAGQQTFTIRANANGRIGTIPVKEGDSVAAGQVLVDIVRPELDDEIAAERRRLAAQKADYAELEKRLAVNLKEQERSVTSQLTSITDAIEHAERLKATLKARVGDLQDLVTRGSARRAEVVVLESQHVEVDNQITELKLKAEQVKANWVDFRTRTNNRLADAKLAVSQQEQRIAQLESDRESSRLLRAPVGGFINEVHVTPGEEVSFKDSLLTLAKGGDGYEVLSFLDHQQGARVTKGLQAHIIPTTVSKAEFGSMRGEVTMISEAPVSLLEIRNLLGDEQLANEFAGDVSPYLSRVKLFPSADNRSGFHWWSGSGPAFPIAVGTEATVEIVVREQRPVSLVVPAIRQFLAP